MQFKSSTLVFFLSLHLIGTTETIQNEDKQPNSTKPNILLIFADDVGIGDIPGYFRSNSTIQMPNIKDELIAKGTSFFDFHSTPLCGTSRYVLLSGNYQDRGTSKGGTFDVTLKTGNQFKFGQQSLAQVLRDEGGYHTAMMGKWHLGARAPVKPSFDPSEHEIKFDKRRLLSNPNLDWSRPIIQGPQDIGFNSSYITLAGIQDPPYKFIRNGKFENPNSYRWYDKGSTTITNIGNSIIGYSAGEGSHDWDTSAYNMILANETKRFILDHKQNHANQPFFAYVALGAAHVPFSPPFNYTDGSQVAGKYPSKHMDILGEMDMVVGSLLQVLKDASMIEDTIIVFTSDNGGENKSVIKAGLYSNFPFRGIKAEAWEGGHRVPYIIRWDHGNVPRNETRSRLVGLNDLFATLCELAGVTIPKGQALDSISHAKYLRDKSSSNGLRNYLRIFAIRQDIEVVRRNQFKLHIDRISGKPLRLYNLNKDPGEQTNLLKQSDWYKHQYLIYDMLHHMALSSSQNPNILKCYNQRQSFSLPNGKRIKCDSLKLYQCKNPIIKMKCPVTCAGACYTLCRDDKKKFWISIANKKRGKTSCSEIYQKGSSGFCPKWTSARINCPVTCDTCPGSSSHQCKDTNSKILMYNGKYKSCSEMTHKNCDSNKKVQILCPRTCGTCKIINKK
jgi:arylsulfatase A-like enzyme